MEPTLFWMVVLPFLGSMVLGVAKLINWRSCERFAGPIACAFIFLSFFCALRVAYIHLEDPHGPPTTVDLGIWIDSANMSLKATLLLDALSSILVLIVTGIGFLIHIYSLGYMAHDEGRLRYFSYLNLFCGFMLVLLTASSLPFLFVGWEGVGLCSYLLIGFWYGDRENAKAGRKAFVVNRIGDAGFIMAMVLAFRLFGTLEFSEIASHPALVLLARSNVLEILAILLFMGCVGKSAQFPLYIWLPDAMAGPTPVSALIHAATMVTAGVYLLARMHFLFYLTPLAQECVAVVGAFTAIFGATIAVAQHDIKRVLAFSTVSQLGYMVLAMGVGAYSAGIFHLVTHAYFKALLFLAAGSVIHALQGEQNILKMGGLKTYLIASSILFLCGFFAIIGFPPFSGWFSKDLILFSVIATSPPIFFWIGLVTAILTTIYMTRLFYLVFLGIPKIDQRKLRDIHESPTVMLFPMAVLAILSILGGIRWFSFQSVLNEVLPGQIAHVQGADHGWFTEGRVTLIVTLTVLLTATITLRTYVSWTKQLEVMRQWSARLLGFLENEYQFNRGVVNGARRFSHIAAMCSQMMDTFVIDKFVNSVSKQIQGIGKWVARFQTGAPQTYVMMILIGFLVMGWILLEGVPK